MINKSIIMVRIISHYFFFSSRFTVSTTALNYRYPSEPTISNTTFVKIVKPINDRYQYNQFCVALLSKLNQIFALS